MAGAISPERGREKTDAARADAEVCPHLSRLIPDMAMMIDCILSKAGSPL